MLANFRIIFVIEHGGAGLPLDLTAQAMSTSILQVHGAHLRRTQSKLVRPIGREQQQQTYESIYRAHHQWTSSTPTRRSTASDGNNSNSDKTMTKAQISVVPLVEDSYPVEQQIAAGLTFSTTAAVGSIHPWAQSFGRWFANLGRHSGERAPLVVDDNTTTNRPTDAGRRWPPGGHDGENLV